METLDGLRVHLVFQHHPIDELKAAIRQEIIGISPQIIARVMETFRNQLRMCIEKNGRHLDSNFQNSIEINGIA